MNVEAWHFLRDDRRLRWAADGSEPGEVVETGKTLICTQPLALCRAGFHASERAVDALGYAPGACVCRVVLSGELLRDTDKIVASERTVLWMADATRTLHEFALWCAESALRRADVQDERSWRALKVKKRWIDNDASDEELAAAGDAAWAARAAARDTAMAAAWGVAWAVAWAAAWGVAKDAAWGAARDAGGSQNEELTRRLMALKPQAD